MIKVSDYIAKRLKEVYGVKDVFLVSGGGAMHLNDAMGRYLNYICNHHEQASAIAAEGYARLNQELAVVNVTTGPGGINALNGVFGQWTDSVPVLYISGQVKHETTIDSCRNLGLRQFGDQEVDIVNVVRPLVKYVEMVRDAKDVKAILDKAIKIATTGRFGPVWIDIPMDIQGAYIEENELREYDTSVDNISFENYDKQVILLLELLENAKSPILVAGHGIRLSGSQEIFLKLVNKLNIPVVTTMNGFDVIEEHDNCYIGRIGTLGQRAGNFALQNSDLVICLGTRNNIRQISYNWENYANKAKIVSVDIDKSELLKPSIKLEQAIHADLKNFLPSLIAKIEDGKNLPNFTKWLNWCLFRKQKYHPTKDVNYLTNNEYINPYLFTMKLSEAMQENDVLVGGNGTAFICPFQAATVKNGQRYIWNSGDASMGYDLPAAIGACFANDRKNIICLSGEGSLMMNLQELQTIKHYNLPIKLFILNNDGYISIQQTQRNFFPDNIVACTQDSGVTFPDFLPLAQVFGFKTVKIDSADNLVEQIKVVLDHSGPIVCEVMLDRNYSFIPKATAQRLPDGKLVSKSLDDMFPFLDQEEVLDNVYHS